MRLRVLQFAVILLAQSVLFGQARKEEPVGLIRTPGGAKLVRAGDSSGIAARAGDVLFSGDTLRAGDAPVSFVFCPGKITQNLQPKTEVILDGKQVRVRSGKLGESTPTRACFLPTVARLGAASEQHYGVSLTRGLPQDESLVASSLLPSAVKDQLQPVEQAITADPDDLSALLSRAAIFEQNQLLANAAHEYRGISRRWPEALWLRGKLFELDEALAAKAAADAAAQLGGQMYGVMIGISKYQKLPADLQLNYAHSDAVAFADHFSSPRGGGIPAANLTVLTNEQATTGGVRMALDNMVKGRLGAKDTLVLFVAAHGVVDSNGSKKAYILTNDSDTQDLGSTAYAMAEFRQVIDQALHKAGRVMVFVDICRAGVIGNIRSTSISASVEGMNDLEGELFGFMAAGPKELSYEGPEFAGGTKHGAFTYYVLRGLQGEADSKLTGDAKSDGIVTVRELIKWVPVRVSEATKDRQLPKEIGSMSRDVALSWLDKPGATVSAAPQWLSGDAGLLAGQQVVRPSGQTRETDEFGFAIRNGKVLPGDSKGAFDILPNLRASLLPTDYKNRENELRIELDNRAQQILLRYLQGDQNPQSRADFELGEALMAAGLKLTPESVLLQARHDFFAGRALLFEKRYAEAVNLLERSIRLDPAAAYAWNALGIAYLQQARFAEATAAFRDASRRATHWSYPVHNLALASAEAGDYNAGIRYYQQAIAITPDAGYLHYNLGVLYGKLNRRKEAEKAYKQAIGHMENMPEAYNALGSLRYAEGKTDEAEKLYRQALTKNPRFTPALHNLALLEAERRDAKGNAIELWERVLTIDPDYSVSRLSMAEFLTKKGQNDRAIEEYRELLKRNPDSAAARLGLAGVYAKVGRNEDALEQFRAILRLDAANLDVMERAGDLALIAGHADEAKKTWKDALERPGEGSVKKRIRRKLEKVG